MQELELASIPEDAYADYKYDVIFGAYKWDPQVEDHNTVSRHVVLMSPRAAAELEQLAEQLADETVRMEEALLGQPVLAKELGFPREVQKVLPRLSGYRRERHVRLMRFDFHPTADGWAISEVNSDVPGGLAEASILPQITARHFPGFAPRHHIGDSLLRAFQARIPESGTVAFVHATAYSDDRQVMQFLADHFEANGLRPLLAGPDHLRWENRRAHSIIEGLEGEVDGIVRFFPLEWLANLPRQSGWAGYYDCETVSCNHPIAIYTQSKRLPLVWDRLGVDIPAWKRLLPETADPKRFKNLEDGWIFKPALGRVGEGISIREAIAEKEMRKIQKAVRRYPRDWLAQRRFESRPLPAADGTPYHLCVGVFTVDGKCAGFYGRISPYPRIDANARDIPLLVQAGGQQL